MTVRWRTTSGTLDWPTRQLWPTLARVGLSERLLASVPVAAWYGLLYALVSLVSFWPIFLGYVPIPAEIITSAPLWGPFQIPFSQRYYGVMEDLVRSFYPGHRLIGEAIRSGEIPLWNPYVLNGYPMHAANAMAIFAPLTIVGYLLPIDAAWTFGMVAAPGVRGARDGALCAGARPRPRRRAQRRLRVRLVRLPGRLGRPGDGRHHDLAALGHARRAARRRGGRRRRGSR